MNNRIIKNARVVDPSQGLDEVLDILIQNGKIAGLGHGFPQKDAQVLDAKGLTAIPGLVDMHVHLRDPGFTHKEDILTGCEAAAAGGVCTVACMHTKPAADTLRL
ncbi:MAG: amidohydrolase family protein [Oscillospiraceae bacterium]